MKVEYVTPFVGAAITVLKQVVQNEPERGALTARPQMFTSKPLNIVCGITGAIEGQVIYGMAVNTADKIASAMLGSPITAFDQLAASAIAELGNMVSGNAMTLLANQGFVCDITPPTIVKGSNVRISTLNIPSLVIPLTISGMGELEINISLRERVPRAA